MSSQAPPPPPQSYGDDPKASAKAAQAYAKASRPWYKKKRWIAAIVIVIIIIIAAASGGGDSEEEAPEAEATNSQSGDGQSAPDDGAEGATEQEVPDNSSTGRGPITWGNWEVVGRLQVTEEEFTGDYSVVTRVTNTGDSPDSGLFTVTILQGNEILGTADCSTSEAAPGATVTANCISVDTFNGDYDEVTIENTF